MVKHRKWDEILTVDEVYFAEELIDLIVGCEMPFNQIKKVINLILEYDDINKLMKSVSY